MKKILSYILTVTLLCGVTVSCSDDTYSGPAEETVIMFFPYCRLESYMSLNISKMQTAIINRGGLGHKRLIVFQATSSTSASVYEIRYEDDVCIKNQIDKLSMHFSSTDQTEVITTLQSMLEMAKTKAPASSYAMIIGSHGSSFMPAGTPLSNCDEAYPTASKSSAMHKAFGTASDEGQIDISSLATAIQNEKMHMNYILFDACYMSSIESDYELRNVTDYVIASQNEIEGDGVPYDIAGNALLEHDYEEVVNQYYNYYNSHEYPYGSLSVTACKYIDGMAAIVRSINTTNSINTDLDLTTVQNMDCIRPTVFYDMGDYFNKACTDATLLADFNNKLDQMVPYKKSTAYIYTAYPLENKKSDYFAVSVYCGISTSQPTTNATATPCVQNTSWWKATH